MRVCPLIAGAPPVVPGEENRWHHAIGRLQRLTAAVFGLTLIMSWKYIRSQRARNP